jgi:hypothetical protein
MLYPVIKCECGNKKVADPRGKHIDKSYSKNGVPIIEEEDVGEFYLAMNVDGININYMFFFFIFLFGVSV